MTSTSSRTGSRPPRRVRSPRKAREWIDRAAVEIAETPEDWANIVDSLRADLGKEPLASDARASYQFVRCRVRGRPASYPVRRLTPVAGGGMNAVLRASELFLERELAFRRHLPAESAVEASARERREAILRERLSTLPRHPVIPRYWVSGSVDGDECDIFDFAPGVSLQRYTLLHGLAYGFLLDFALHAARGLLYLHGNDLIHGDVKPENFCVEPRAGPDGDPRVRVHLIDFDIVSTPEEQLTQYALGNALEGTLPYMPPENFAQWVPDDPAEGRRMVFGKDVYALGLTLARVINGRFPDSFYTGIDSLLAKKTAGEEVVVKFPDTIPTTLQVLIRAMCAGDWMQRPGLPVVIRTVRGLRESASREELNSLVIAPNPAALAELRPKPEKPEHVGPYNVVDRSFSRRPPGDPQQDLPIAELKDAFGRKLVGVPFAFATREKEQAFYEERCDLLKDLNTVRIRYSELFPGAFRDLVREEKDGRHLVWIIRPLLEGALDLRHFLASERPEAPVGERVAILRRAAQALSALEEAGYVFPRLTPELIFFVPQPADHLGGTTVTRAALTRPLKRLFDVPASQPGHRYRQELMGTASAIRGAGSPSTAVDDLLDIAREIGLYRDLTADERAYLEQIRPVATWRERAEILIWIEGQHS